MSGAVVKALSERLVVSTMHHGHRYRAAFSKGTIVSLLAREHCHRPLAITWLTFRPHPTIVSGETLKLDEVQRVAERVERNAEGVRILVEEHEDRTTEDADWC